MKGVLIIKKMYGPNPTIFYRRLSHKFVVIPTDNFSKVKLIHSEIFYADFNNCT